VIQDLAAAGLQKPSAFRVYLWTQEQEKITSVGHLSDRDWREVQRRMRIALDLGQEPERPEGGPDPGSRPPVRRIVRRPPHTP
jgi:hypothetical protein